MSGGNRFRYGVVLGVALILAACNRPDLVDAAANPTSRPLSLEEIETAVVATLEVEGEMTAAARPSDTPTAGEPSATPASTSTPALALTSTHTPTSIPTANPTLAPPTNTLPPPPSATPKPTDKPTSAPPTNTPCPKFTNATLSASVDTRINDVNLAWGTTGGCGSYEGSLTATYKGEDSPYATHGIKIASGKQTDNPPVRCEGTFTIVYTLTLRDSSGQTVTAGATVEVTWLC